MIHWLQFMNLVSCSDFKAFSNFHNMIHFVLFLVHCCCKSCQNFFSKLSCHPTFRWLQFVTKIKNNILLRIKQKNRLQNDDEYYEFAIIKKQIHEPNLLYLFVVVYAILSCFLVHNSYILLNTLSFPKMAFNMPFLLEHRTFFCVKPLPEWILECIITINTS